MRIRRKKHLGERLSLVSDYLLVADRDIANIKLAIQDKKYLDYSVLFSNQNPVELEIGCGKGGFIIEKAIKNPNINYLAVELLENIVVMSAEKAKELNLKNIKFFNCGADYLPRYIKEKSISNIYLNFSPPYPQKSYESHRLTCKSLVNNYHNFLVDGGKVFQKTDDEQFFNYSKEMFSENNFLVEDISNLLNNNQIENIQTEYEKKFRALGLPVYRLIATKN